MRALLIDLSPLRRYRDFRLLWTAHAVTSLGSMITFVAVPYQVYELTRSTLLVGLLGVVEFVALMSAALIGGALADSVDRRLMMLSTEAGMLLISMGLFANALLDNPSLAALYVLAGLNAGLYALQRPSSDAMVPRLVPQHDLVAASALAGVRGTFAMVLGPMVGGVLLATVGLMGAYLVDIASFAVSLALLVRMAPMAPPEGSSRATVRGSLEGWHYARKKPVLLGTYLVDMNAQFFGMPNALFPAMAVGFGGPKALGLLFTAPAVGALAVSIFSGWASRVRRQGLAILWAAGIWGVALIGFGLSSSLWPALVMLCIAGGADMVSGLFRMAIWNTTVPDELRGRLAGIELISYTSGPTLGNFEAGAVASLTSARFSAGLGGVLSVAGTLVIGAALPEFRAYVAPSGRPEDDVPGGEVGPLEYHLDPLP